MTEKIESLGEAYPKEQQRCRELLEEYKAIGPNGIFGYSAISAVLQRADKAAISGDVAKMMISFQEMRECG